MTGYSITDAVFRYRKVYGIPSYAGYADYDIVPDPASDNMPEYIRVDGQYYRLHVGISYGERSFLINFVDANMENIGGMIPEMYNTGFARITMEGLGYRVWCDRNRGKVDRVLSLWFRGGNDPWTRLEIPIWQDCEHFLLSLNADDLTHEVSSLLGSGDTRPVYLDPIPIECSGGKADFKVFSINVKSFYGKPVNPDDIQDISDEEFREDISPFTAPMTGDGWVNTGNYAKMGGSYYSVYVNTENEPGYIRADMDVDPLTNMCRLYRMTKTDGAITAYNDNGSLCIVNNGRIYKSENMTPSNVYEITVCHVNDSNAKAVISVYYMD